MPQFMKNQAITILDGGIESYILALYGLALPSLRSPKKADSKFAPVIGLLGASVELIVKACLVQAKGSSAMYKNGDISSGVYKFGTEVLGEFKAEVKKDSSKVKFLWKKEDDHEDDRKELISLLNKFSILQSLRAAGLHAGKGCSRDIVVSTANDIYRMIQLLAQGKRLKPYLKGIPEPEATIRDREAIIEDLSRRITSAKSDKDKLGYLRNMYLVMPYIPDEEPEWIQLLDKLTVVPPTKDDITYLVKSMEEAHSIYFLKNRGGKDGIPVRVDPTNPNALPIDIQNIKRKLNGIPAEFNNDVLTANTRIDQNRLQLPIDDFLIDLFALGIDASGIMQGQEFLTAQQVWPFVVSAFSTQGTPRPCMQLIAKCDEKEQLLSYLKKAETIGNGYYRRRYPSLVKCIDAMTNGNIVDFSMEKDKAFSDLHSYKFMLDETIDKPINATQLRKNPVSEKIAPVLVDYLNSKISVGKTIEEILRNQNISIEDRKIVRLLMDACRQMDNRNGLVAIIRNDNCGALHSEVRKRMFALDILSHVQVQ